MAQSRGKGRTHAPRNTIGKDIAPPPMPPKSAEEERESEEMVKALQEMTRLLRARNLANAVLLAQQAAGGQGELVDHFAELGRRYGHLLRSPQKPPALRVVDGGKS